MQRDFTPTIPCAASRTGSDSCEATFAMLTGSGQINNGGQRTYTSEDVRRTVDGVNAMHLMQHVTFKRNHSKQEYKPKIMEDQSLPDADLLAYPSVEESVAAWNGGFDEARKMAISLGINSVENGGNVPKDFWEKPWIGEIDDAEEMRNDELR
jgi:hypothetical protein